MTTPNPSKKQRSPNYPALSLPQAVAVLQRLWKAEKRTPVDHETAALAMGFKSLSGPARVAIGALRQYGLIAKAGKSTIRVSDDGVTIVIGDPPDKAQALVRAAREPELFQELAKAHLDASDNAIQSYLITKKAFAADGARKAAKAFRETMFFAKAGDSGYTHAEEQEQSEIMTASESGQTTTPSKAGDGVFVLNVPFAKGSIAVQVRVSGQPISKAALARVRKYIELAEEDLESNDE